MREKFVHTGDAVMVTVKATRDPMIFVVTAATEAGREAALALLHAHGIACATQGDCTVVLSTPMTKEKIQKILDSYDRTILVR